MVLLRNGLNRRSKGTVVDALLKGTNVKASRKSLLTSL